MPLAFYHYMFQPQGAPWFTGAFWSNQTQWTIVWLPTLVIMYRKKWECTDKGCWRLGHHPVKGTHYKTCNRHATTKVHAKLQTDHWLAYPEAHRFLNRKTK